jgi:hypothetical protein
MSSISSQKVLDTQKVFKSTGATKYDFDEARTFLWRNKIKSSYDENRIIMHINSNNRRDRFNNFSLECNGLILEKGTWDILMLPPRSLQPNINSKMANRYLYQGLYTIYKAYDGTCFNLYYYNDQWCISTLRGYEMNDIAWDTKPYQEIIDECLKEYGFTWSSFTEQLDTSHCYSFGFTHPQFHKFKQHKNNGFSLWFIQSVDLNREAPTYLEVNEKSMFENIPEQELYKEDVKDIRELYHIASSALDSYLKNPDHAPCFGFILRSTDKEKTLDHSDLYIESSLLKKIRKTWYDSRLNKLAHTEKWNKETTITLNAYLNQNLYYEFAELFPDYVDTFAKYSNIIKEIINQMIYQLKRKNKETDDPRQKLLNSIADALLTDFRQTNNYNIQDDTNKEKTFYEYILHPLSLSYIIPLVLFDQQKE